MINKSIVNSIAQGVDPSLFAAAGCTHPIKRKIRLSETGEYKNIYLNCGHCERCLQNKREELSTRMFLHSLGFNYCYFVTLDYGSYDLSKYKYHPFKAAWLQTVPILTSYNSSHKPRWTPTLLIRSHLTNFQKRLRKTVNSELSFASCGEYGEDYLRPHFHVIIWSNVAISYDTFKNAWSLECKRTKDKYYIRPWREEEELKKPENGYFRFYIGNHIKVEDLWANGSLNYDGKHPGVLPPDKERQAMHNFTYVAKYLGKCGPDWVPPLRLLKRFEYAYAVYTRDIDKLMELSPFPYDQQLDIYEQITTAIDYENFPIDQLTFKEFKKICCPYVTTSRRPSLGKIYYLQNRARFQRKEFGLPSFMGKALSCPRYFFYLLALDNYSIRIRKTVDSGISLTKDLLPRLHRYMSSLRDDPNYWYSIRGFYLDSKPDRCVHYYRGDDGQTWYQSRYDNYHYVTQSRLDRFECYSVDYKPHYLNYMDNLDSIDLVTSEGTVHYIYNPNWEVFEGWTYNRLMRDYEFYDYVDREDFCDLVLLLIERDYKLYPDKVAHMDSLFEAQEKIETHPNTPAVRQDYKDRLKELQLKYKSSHYYEL